MPQENLPDSEYLDKIHGCLLGIAMGDAMAMPGLWSRELILKVHGGEITDFTAPSGDEELDPVHALLPAGQGTDDAFASVSIVQHLSRERVLDPHVMVRAYIEWIEKTDKICADYGRKSGFAGPNTRPGMEAIQASGKIPEKGGQGTTSGAAMRSAPLGFLYPGDIARTVDAVEISCKPTHNTGVAIAAASAVACAVSAIAAGETDYATILDAAVEGAERGISRGCHYHNVPSVARRIRFAQDIVSKGDFHTVQPDLYDLVGTSMESHEVVPSALALLTLAKGELRPAILYAANTGGDCDTMGAIAGGIAGAMAGRSGIADADSDLIERVNGFDLATVSQDYLDAINAVWGRSSSHAAAGA